MQSCKINGDALSASTIHWLVERKPEGSRLRVHLHGQSNKVTYPRALRLKPRRSMDPGRHARHCATWTSMLIRPTLQERSYPWGWRSPRTRRTTENASRMDISRSQHEEVSLRLARKRVRIHNSRLHHSKIGGIDLRICRKSFLDNQVSSVYLLRCRN